MDRMSDLIKRQAAIDAAAIKIKKWNVVDDEGHHIGLGLKYTDVIDMLTKLPPAQSEIVRCKGCRHFDKYLVECMNENGLKHIYSKEDYCKYADKDTK